MDSISVWATQSRNGCFWLGAKVVGRPAPGRYARAWVSAPWWELAEQLCTLGPPAGLDWEALPPGGIADLSLDVRAAQD